MLTYMQELHIHKVKKKKHSLNNPEEVKEHWKQAWDSQLTCVIQYTEPGHSAWRTHRRLFYDFLHFDGIAFLSSGGKILTSKVTKYLRREFTSFSSKWYTSAIFSAVHVSGESL